MVYCSAACQLAAWHDHKAACKLNRAAKTARDEALKEKATAKAAPARGNSSGLGDMGSIMAALMPPPQQQQQQQQRYDEGQVYNACFDGHHEELQKMLKQRGIDVNWGEPETGATAAHAAAEGGHDKCLALLSQYAGADLSKMNKRGYASIHLACSFGRHACIEVLLSCGVSANLPNAKEITPAMFCCMNGHVKCLALLSDKGADLSVVSKFGLTAAHYACINGQFKCLQLLISRGAIVNSKDGENHTPLDMARAYKHPECVALLLANGATGQRPEDLTPVPEATKVGTDATYIQCFV